MAVRLAATGMCLKLVKRLMSSVSPMLEFYTRFRIASFLLVLGLREGRGFLQRSARDFPECLQSSGWILPKQPAPSCYQVRLPFRIQALMVRV